VAFKCEKRTADPERYQNSSTKPFDGKRLDVFALFSSVRWMLLDGVL